jgi:ketosteroid isomerase-like protein
VLRALPDRRIDPAGDDPGASLSSTARSGPLEDAAMRLFRPREIAAALIGLLSTACASTRPDPTPPPTLSTSARIDAVAALPAPSAAADALLAADSAFAAAAKNLDLVSALTAMFADDVVMPAPPGRIVRGAAAAGDALRANPDNPKSRVEWTPVRVGVSADGQHGFTFGYMTLTKPDRSIVPLKYLAYWVRESHGWRVAAYKRGVRAAGEVSLAPMPPALPPRTVAVVTDRAALDAHRSSLDAVERAFSDEAQKIGLGAAFARYGSGDAVNLGGPADAGFVVGASAIGLAVSDGKPNAPSPVSWAPEQVIVASSGDLGVTIGTIRPNARPADGTPGAAIPFFTIWRRAGTGDPWRYVAE